MSLLQEENVLFDNCQIETLLRYNRLTAEFHGTVTRDIASIVQILQGINQEKGQKRHIFLTGDIDAATENLCHTNSREQVTFYIIKDFSCNFEKFSQHHAVSLVRIGQVPHSVHNDCGVFYPEFFDEQRDWFNEITSAHQFQSLTESNKNGTALRTGIYLSHVEQAIKDTQNDCTAMQFHLMRCSSNFQGPTESFGSVDRAILQAANIPITQSHENQVDQRQDKKFAPVNHVLAQIYHSKGEKKASIAWHADKTKDMCENGVIAFATFYKKHDDLLEKQNVAASPDDPYDVCYKQKHSIYTQIEFKSKLQSDDKFRLTMYPRSLLIVPLSTNRLYQHRICPSPLATSLLPLRMGYTMRCSNQLALHKNNQTFLLQKDHKTWAPMRIVEPKDADQIKSLYRRENKSIEIIQYPFIDASLNSGDYLCPKMADESEKYNQ